MPSSILNSDDGVISGTSGLKSSGGDDGTLAVQSNGTEIAKFKTTELVINDGGANYDFRVEGDTNTHLLITDASADCVGINITVPVGKLDVVQSSTTAAIPTLKLTQSDLSEEFIRFSATVGAGNPIDTAALGTYYGKVSVYIEGVGAKKMAVYNT